MKLDQHHTTATHYGKPYRPFPVKMFNTAGKAGRGLGIKKDLTLNNLLNSARRQTGLTDFGGDDFLEPLSVLLSSIEEEAYLTPFGRFITFTRLTGVLANRLRAEEWFSRHPEILETELPPVAVISGLQRTGTTMLHRLLASDPDTRALLSWEALNPAPFFLPEAEDFAKRKKAAQMSEKALSFIAPDFFAIHPVEADAPEEDVLLLDYSFLSTVPESTLRVPAYSRWVENQDQTPAYEYMKKLLQLLQWQRPAKRWILKTPHHLEFLDTLFRVFPGAVILQTHRDPCTTIASFCSMIAHGRGVFSDRIDPVEVGAHWARKISRMISRSMAVRERTGGDRFIDIYYRDLVSDPIGEIERIYQSLGIDWTDTLRLMMKRTNTQNKQYKYGRHQYCLSDFGLDERMIQRDFHLYYEKFNVRSAADLSEKTAV